MRYQPKHFNRLPKNRILGRRRGIDPYVFSDDIVIAVDVALATNRPLLVSGDPGSGKSRLADAVAAVQGWNLLGITMTSRTRLESLTAEVDQLRRLNDAQVRGDASELKPDAYYLKPGLFWWAFQPESARRKGLTPQQAAQYRIALAYPGRKRNEGQAHPTVVLIDEIDKAEPDLPNDLLEPLDRRRFDLPDGIGAGDGGTIHAAADLTLLTIITTNGERELPQAFLRRCVALELPNPDAERLELIAANHFPRGDTGRIKRIAGMLQGFRDSARQMGRRSPGTAEFLDAVRACEELDVAVSEAEDSVWKRIERAVLVKDAGA